MTRKRLAEAESVAREILRAHFAVTDAQLTYKEAGLTNYVFDVATRRAPMVLRIGRTEKRAQAFTRERCVIERVREAGIPVPEVLEQGESGDWAYMAVLRMAGEPATHHPKRLDILREVARLAATHIHRIEPIGFGPDFALEGQCGGGGVSWRDWLEHDLGATRRLDFLREQQIITDAHAETLKATLETVRQWTDAPALNHGDLRLKNVLVDDDGQLVGLIDWDSCVSAAGPHWDLSIALHDLTVDQKEAFLDAYGLSAEAVREFAPVWRLFNALNYVPRIDRLLKANDEASIERLRVRFSGALDLYVG